MAALKVNGRTHEVAAAEDAPLLFVLRNDLKLDGPKFGCGLSQCGACTVLVDGQPVRSCVTSTGAVERRGGAGQCGFRCRGGRIRDIPSRPRA